MLVDDFEDVRAGFASSLEEVDVNGWVGFLDDKRDFGFFLKPYWRRCPTPALAAPIETTDPPIVGSDDELCIIGDDVLLVGADGVGRLWVDAAHRLEDQRLLAADAQTGIWRRGHTPLATCVDSMGDWAAERSGFDADAHIRKFGLPTYEEYDGMRTASLPNWFWVHELADGTRVYVKYHVGHSDNVASIEVDPGDPVKAMNAVGLDVNAWNLNPDGKHFVCDREGNTTGTWQVWRQGDDGHEVLMKDKLPEAVARRWEDIYTARGHKQLYWVQNADDDG